MNPKARRYTAFTIAVVLLSPQVAVAVPGAAGAPHRIAAAANPAVVTTSGQRRPQRIAVPEPARRTPPPMPPAASIHPTVSHDVRRASGTHVLGPPMLRPSELDAVLAAARTRAKQRSLRALGAPQAERSIAAPARARGAGSPATSQVRATQSVQSPSGTGINPWWRYQESSVPGDGRLMVNVGTGNVLLQDDDMNVPHKGIALAFRRTYNSQSLHDVNGDEGGVHTTTPGMYGNGWTNTFDAHLVKAGPGNWSVYDIDGARYDYVANVPNDASAGYTGPPGQHATLASDGQCGMTWTKKSGTIYYFYRDNPAVGCPALPSIGGYAGRLYQIIGRNRNTSLTFNYSWDNNDASATGKVSAISVTTESGLTATLSFADVSGHRLLQQITFPDGSTNVQYGYDANGNLTSVTEPPNNAAGTNPMKFFGYQAIGSGYVMQWASSPRWDVCTPGCGNDGGYVYFGYGGSTVPTSTLAYVIHGAYVNPSISDGYSSGPLQPAYTSSYTNFLSEYFTTGTTTPTLRDTDGHATNWIMDSAFRPTQIQECTASANQACSANAYLTTNQTWDSDNNLVSEVDPRGGETDFLHDPMGNTTAVGEPYTDTSQGSFKPTQLYDYDAFNNVVAYCDANEVHAANADWTPPATPISTNDSLCSSQIGAAPHWRATYANPSWEPYGELTSMTSPLGYARHIGYRQDSSDDGLPVSVSGDPITQLDGTSITPAQTFWYDANGYLRCYSKGHGTSVLSYDNLGRLLSVADPDDSSANAGSLCGKSTGKPGWNTQTTYSYFPDGSKHTAQTPSERAFGVQTSYTYDIDGNLRTETTHHGCVVNQTCTAGTTSKWYDGAGRLVEVAQPFVSSATDLAPWLTRYIYDLSSGGTVSLTGSAAFPAYGNLYKTQTLIGGWTDVRGSAFDALDREVQKFAYSIPDHRLETTTQQYDATTATLGKLASKTNPNLEQATYTYDAAGHVASVQYSGDHGLTPAETYQYDPDGKNVSVTSSQFGIEQHTYDGDGRLTAVIEPTGGGLTDPAHINYTYYGNGSKAAVSVVSQTFTQANAITYSYRVDGPLQTQSTNAFQSGTWNKMYTDAGRLQAITGIDTQTRTYDSTGQLATYTLGGSTLSYTHDPEGSVETLAVPNVMNPGNAQPVTETLTNGLNARGELVEQSYSPNPSYQFAHTISTFTAGYRDTTVEQVNGTPPDTNDTVDYVNLVRSQHVVNGQPSDPYNGVTYTTGSSSAFTFDASGRETHSSAISDTFEEYENAAGNTMAKAPHHDDEASLTYDAENHTRSYYGTSTQYDRITSSSGATSDRGTIMIGWGPNGHVVQAANYPLPGTGTTTETLHWDGDTLLFVTDPSGTVLNFNVGRDGVTGPKGLTVIDRDTAGVTLMGSNATGHSGLIPLDPDYGYGPDIPGTPGYVNGTLGDFPYIRDDAISTAWGRVSGPRTYDPGLASWTTPDAYEGDIHDPASQQRYMWNRNNPYEYSDPSGYNPVLWGLLELASHFVASHNGTNSDPHGCPCPIGRIVIGKMQDLRQPGAIKPGEQTMLASLPNQGNEEANWKMNKEVLHVFMNARSPIRDASVNFDGTQKNNSGFLAKERNELKAAGWHYDEKTTLWTPPKALPTSS